MQFCCALGHVDDAFAVAQALYLNRGFRVPDRRFSPAQGSFTTLRNRHTYALFLPSTAAMRADSRFDSLARELGLADYWRQAGVTPDYRRG